MANNSSVTFACKKANESCKICKQKLKYKHQFLTYLLPKPRKQQILNQRESSHKFSFEKNTISQIPIKVHIFVGSIAAALDSEHMGNSSLNRESNWEFCYRGEERHELMHKLW